MQVETKGNTFRDALERRARSLFEHDQDVLRWVNYWGETVQRNEELLRGFESRVKLDFTGKTVLDVGCGTGGLAKRICDSGGRYAGLDFHGILTFSKLLIADLGLTDAHVARASATHLPIKSESVDYLIAFDVIEHLIGGYPWQLQFMMEMRRVLKPKGLIFLTTQNKLYPFEGHTYLYFPHYLPVKLADMYIRWRRPWFFKEYWSFREVRLLSQWSLKKLLNQARLALLHDLPWCMDIEDNPPRRRLFLQVLRWLGLDWAWVRGFWLIACRQENLAELQTLKTKEWLRPPISKNEG